ncbi:MAG: four helix bundle protein [Acutalibacteraceae bacterium]|nr:four helix bundle protein [Acutalibacteraceae bacterium]
MTGREEIKLITYYEDLVVWQRAMDLVEETYRLVKLLPREEDYVLASQMRRAAVSIPSNIAEGQSRHTTKEFLNFLSIANGSKSELKTQLQICVRLGYVTAEQTEKATSLLEEISKMLYALMIKLQRN